MGTEQSSFQDRIERIRKNAEETSSKAPPPRTDSIWQRLGYPASFVGAFVLGVFAVFLTRYIQYHTVGVPEGGQLDAQEIINIGLASGAGFFVSFFLRDRQKEFASSVTMGVLVTTFTYHNLVWKYPDFFEVVYGEDWVEFVEKLTEPSSLYLFGNIVKLG
ncbi:hypothetical protein [Ruegeria lacuscaerulensis]|uniref:hypothetical protein n=1 Tax=Ruegeria lacuscaerulensis TaxID=55218 RepID=UPI00147F5A6E|nr:hypothetical protein [Ruegeria lacuscaerulensis]